MDRIRFYEFLYQYRFILTACVLILFLFIIFGSVFLLNRPTVPTQQPFTVIATVPQDGTQNYYTGESRITFTTNVPILSKDAFTMTISPELPYYWKINNTYPTSEVSAQIYGMLEPGTTYTVTVTDTESNKSYSWSFTTSHETPESSTGLEVDENQQLTENFYPLAPSLPFTTNDFSIDYIDRLTLEVRIKNQETEAVKYEVNEWIRSKNVDPSTHTINYINDF